MKNLKEFLIASSLTLATYAFFNYYGPAFIGGECDGKQSNTISEAVNIRTIDSLISQHNSDSIKLLDSLINADSQQYNKRYFLK